MSNCSLGSLSGQLKYSRHLKKLHLNNNELAYLGMEDFANLANLEELNLSYNKLIQLPTGIFESLPRLRRLFLDCNPLTSLPARMFQNNPRVVSFRLSGKACSNKMMELSLTSRMFYSPQLKSIVVKNVKIDFIFPDWLENCSGRKLIGDLFSSNQSVGYFPFILIL